MQVKVDILEGLQRKLTIEVPFEELDKKIFSDLKKAQKKAKLNGFRKGKAPMETVKKQYYSSIAQDALSDIIDLSYNNAIKENNLMPAGQPKIDFISGLNYQSDKKENIIYEAVLEIMPDFDVKGVSDLEIKKPISEIKGHDIDQMIDKLRKQHSNWENSDKNTANDDKVTVDFEGKIDGEIFEGGSANNISIILGAKQMLPEFETALFNQKVGDTVNANVTFPEAYHSEELSGKTAVFEIKIKSVEKPVLLELDGEFIKKFGFNNGDIESFKDSIRKNMEVELKKTIRTYLNQQVMNQLIDLNEIIAPQVMIENEKQQIAKEQQLEKSIQNKEEREKIINEQFTDPARRRAILRIVLGKLVDEHKIEASQERIAEKIQEISASYDSPEKVSKFYNKNPEAFNNLYAQVIEDQLIDLLIEKAKIIEEEMSFEELTSK